MDETKLTADLPNMRMEVVHRMAEDGSGEHMTIQLHATPDFRRALPLVGSFTQLPWMLGPLASPWTLWAQAAEALLEPWMALAKANPFLALASDDISGKFKK